MYCVPHDKLRKIVVVNQDLSITSPIGTFHVNLIDKGVIFPPSKMIIRQVIYSNINGVDSGSYLIWTNLTNDYIGGFYVGIQGESITPLTEIPIYMNNSVQTCIFQISPANKGYHPVSGNLTLVLEFIGF